VRGNLFFLPPESSSFLLSSFPKFSSESKLFNTYGPLIEPFRGDPPPSFPKSFIGNPHAFKYCGPLIETFRGDGLGVIEPFRGDPPPSFPKSFIGNPEAFVFK